MNIFSQLRSQVLAALAQAADAGILPHGTSYERVSVDPPRDTAHGDAATNAAMVLSKVVERPPRELATQLLPYLSAAIDSLEDIDIAGAGFINMRLKPTFWHQQLLDILESGNSYGQSSLGQGEKVNVEYVSANPTGPLHVGHTRSAIIGDTLANLLHFTGHEVTKEYYINDGGGQIEALARSVYGRYCHHFGHHEAPLGQYPGEYLEPIAQKLAQEHGDRLLTAPEAEWLPLIQTITVEAMMHLIREDLDALGIHHDIFTSEKELLESGKVDEMMQALTSIGLIYRGTLPPPKGAALQNWSAREQDLFAATQFGDDVDRAMRKEDGTYTYFATDVANHYYKFQRGFKNIIDIFGADHAGYVKRTVAATKAVTQNQANINIQLCQMVRFMENGQPLKMSKRAGTFITAREVLDKIGKDVLRFAIMTRKSDAPMDFDFAKVVEQSKDNLVFYVQYAHARICSVQRHIQKMFPTIDVTSKGLTIKDIQTLTEAAELQLIQLLTQWPRQLEQAALAKEPHRLAYYLGDVATAFHSLWTTGKDNTHLRFIHPEDMALTRSKLGLLNGIKTIIRTGLTIFGVKPVEEM